jgi:hypothetical protein
VSLALVRYSSSARRIIRSSIGVIAARKTSRHLFSTVLQARAQHGGPRGVGGSLKPAKQS